MQLRSPSEEPAMVRVAMAHLNFVMIHPFRDGNGRMVCIQTLVLAREGSIAPPFWSIEEYLGVNTDAYYHVLADVGAGSWHPERDARPWVRFVLNAAMGFRLRNATYRETAAVTDAVAGRDLKALVDAELPVSVGERRGRFYVAGARLKGLEASIRRQPRTPIEDPFLKAPAALGL